MNKRGFIPILIIGIIAAVAVLGTGGYFYVSKKTFLKSPKNTEAPVLPKNNFTNENKKEDVKKETIKKEEVQKNSYSPQKKPSLFQQQNENRKGYEILTESERARLPECADILMKEPPVPLSSVVSIEPIGSANPPEHTLASISSDTYIGVVGQGSTKTTPLVAPGDMWIIFIQPRTGVTQDPEDHVIKYAFCKDVYGVVDHVKSFSPEIKKLIDEYKCQYGGVPGDNRCPITLLQYVKAGTPLGSVGRMQGNFNFGTWDLRTSHFFANPSRHGHLTKYSTCPFDYYDKPLRDLLLEKLETTVQGKCGSVEHDVAGTLAGDWFIGNATPMRPSDWGKLLYFGPHNRFPDQSVISVGGIIVPEATKWTFKTRISGTINARFEDVKPGKIYCYEHENSQYSWVEKGVTSGRFLVELTTSQKINIEHQMDSCQNSDWIFKKPTEYIR
ncbi:MAG TPA: hypothetical protein VJH05_02050 [Candidatus Paceibacterota bacterium]